MAASDGLDLSDLREEYARAGLAEEDLDPDPFAMFSRWFDEVREVGIAEPNAMVVATADAGGAPSVRTVLLKGVDDAGFRFFTNTTSRKGHDLAANSRCALLFPWHPLERQVRVEGVAAPLPRADVEGYFSRRPRASQLGAWASHQSSVVDGGAARLRADYDDADRRFAETDVPTPEEWGGYVVAPERFEFWQGRKSRMHDRLRYRRGDAGEWVVERLAP